MSVKQGSIEKYTTLESLYTHGNASLTMNQAKDQMEDLNSSELNTSNKKTKIFTDNTSNDSK
jgi:hypothetical protein